MRVLGLCRETKEEEEKQEKAGLCGPNSSLYERSQYNFRKKHPDSKSSL